MRFLSIALFTVVGAAVLDHTTHITPWGFLTLHADRTIVTMNGGAGTPICSMSTLMATSGQQLAAYMASGAANPGSTCLIPHADRTGNRYGALHLQPITRDGTAWVHLECAPGEYYEAPAASMPGYVAPAAATMWTAVFGAPVAAPATPATQAQLEAYCDSLFTHPIWQAIRAPPAPVVAKGPDMGAIGRAAALRSRHAAAAAAAAATDSDSE